MKCSPGDPGLRSLHSRPNENIIIAQMTLNPQLMETVEGRESLGSLTGAQVDESFAALEAIKEGIPIRLKVPMNPRQLPA